MAPVKLPFSCPNSSESTSSLGIAPQFTQSALEVYPGHVPTIEALARLQISTGRESKELPQWLDVIALQGETEEWREWAERTRIKRQQRN